MDDKLTLDLKNWLDTTRENRDVVAGATLLLQLNRNRILHQNILRHPEKMHDKLEHELRKHLGIRLEGYTLQEVLQMEAAMLPKVAQLVEENSDAATENEVTYHGKRDDHDNLPPEIQALWEDNSMLFFRIKEIYYRLLEMQDSPICDRFELLKILSEADNKYRENLKNYDHFVISDEVAEEGATSDATTSLTSSEEVIVQLPTTDEVAEEGATSDAATSLTSSEEVIVQLPTTDEVTEEGATSANAAGEGKISKKRKTATKKKQESEK